MSSRNATVRILACFVLWCALFTVNTYGRSLQRTRRHHHSMKMKNLTELEMERETLIQFHDDVQSHRTKEKHFRHHNSNRDISFDEKTQTSRKLENREPHVQRLSSSSRRSHAIRKRHNGASDDVAYATLSDADMTKFMNSQARVLRHPGFYNAVNNEPFQFEVKMVQNSSLCNYTVKDIPDTSNDQSRTPKKLVNIICNYAGSRCRDVGTYCCIQTYSKIDVSYGNRTSETIKIFTGCVCSLLLIAEQSPNSISKPRIND